MLKIINKLPGYQPLCYVSGGLLLARRKMLFICDLNLENIKYVCRIPVTFRERQLSRLRILSRIFRLDVRCALNVGDKFTLVVCGQNIWRVSLDTFDVTLDFVIPDGRTALYLTHIKSDDNQADKVVFGEYFSNPSKGAARVWSIETGQKSSWRILHEFKSGEINHVHNVIYDKGTDDCFILTGDFGDGAAIWKTTGSFSEVKCLARGDQNYRACWAIVDDDGLSYATDTQLQYNSFCKFVGGKVDALEQIEGSSIYYGKNESQYFFSTTVEPDEPSGHFIRDVFSYKLGKGILSNSAKIYSLASDRKSIKVEFSGIKDLYPTRLAQFGSFTFPSGVSNGEGIIVFAVALKNYDGCCMLLGYDNQGDATV